MRILYLLTQIPFPPDNGFKQRYAGLLRDLASRNEVAVACFATPGDKLSDHAVVTSEFVSFNYVRLPSSIPTSYPQGWLSSDPSEVRFLASPSMAELVDRLVARHEPEVIVVGDPALTQYVAKHDTTPRVLDYMCDAILGFKRLEDLSSGPGKWLNALRAKKYARFLRRISRHYERCVSSSQEDRDSIATAWPSERPIDIIPVGVEPDRYPRNLAEPVPGRMIYPGAITYEPNRDAVAWFASKILPRIRARVPNAELWVTGRRPTDGSEPKADGLHFTGYVEDIRVAISSAWVTVVPLRAGAGGQRLKVLESMALGTPLVSTAIGYEGLAVENRKHLLAAESSETFAECCIELLGDATLRAHLTTHARELLETRYSWRTIGRDFEAILTKLAERPRQPA